MNSTVVEMETFLDIGPVSIEVCLLWDRRDRIYENTGNHKTLYINTYINHYLPSPFIYINQMKATRVEFATLTSFSPSLLMKSFSSGTEASPSVKDDLFSRSLADGLMRAFISAFLAYFLIISTFKFMPLPYHLPIQPSLLSQWDQDLLTFPSKNSGSITEGQGQGAPSSVIYLVLICNIF